MKKRSTAQAEQPGWSFVVDTDAIGLGPVHYSIEATEKDRAALAERMDIPAIGSLSAEIDITRSSHNKAVVHVQGTLKADVTQECVVSHAPIHSHILEDFEAWYADREKYISLDKARHERQGRSVDAEIQMMEEREDPEPMVNGKIDLGDLVGQYLSLGLDPYPQLEGAVPDKIPGVTVVPEGAVVESPLRRNPFEALKKLKGRDTDEGK